jgi:uncharacterized protein
MPENSGPATGTSADPTIAKERTDPRCLELLVCPLTKTMLEYDEPRQELISRRANLAYPIRSGVPLLTREAARNLDDPIKKPDAV